jgi:nucleotide-binding universal stress UspA family protein
VDDDGVSFAEGGVMRKIIVGYDGSESAQRALLRLVELVHNGTSVTVISSVPLDVGSLGPELPEPSDVAEHVRQLEEALEFLKTNGIKVRGIEVEGNPAGLVVVGTGGKNAVERFVLGSVSDKVAHRAPCDVLVVR